MCSFMAHADHYDNLQLAHMRQLMLKFIKAVDSDGGINLHVYGFKITYVNVIKVSLHMRLSSPLIRTNKKLSRPKSQLLFGITTILVFSMQY